MKIRRVSDKLVRNFRLRLNHISDTHSGFPKLCGRFDAVIHTGDFFPNSIHLQTGNRTQEMMFQQTWLEEHLNEMKLWLQGHTFLYVLGNHDFLHAALMEQILCSAGIKAIDITNKMVTYEAVNFYGFPYVPAINGMFCYEREIPEMQAEVDKIVPILNETFIDVLACHAPLYKTLDLSMGNQLCGSTVIADALDYKISKNMTPAYYLCGHIHEAHGITVRNGMVVSNAACTQNILEV